MDSYDILYAIYDILIGYVSSISDHLTSPSATQHGSYWQRNLQTETQNLPNSATVKSLYQMSY